MKPITAYVFAVTALLVASAPTTTKEPSMNNEEQDILRDKRSQYGVPYISPCNAAAASAPIPSYSPYHVDFTPMQAEYAVPHYGYTGPHYRSIDPTVVDQELLGFSDMEHVMSENLPMARYGTYGVPSHPAGSMKPIVAPAHTNPTPAFGVFPSGNTGGYNVPLLFSCTPSIVQGQIVKTQPNYAYNPQVNSYRGVDDHLSGHVNRQEESGSHEHSADTIIHDPSHVSLHQ